MRNMTEKEFNDINNSSGKQKEQLIDATIRKMFPDKNHDCISYKIGKEYTWKGFTKYDDVSGDVVDAICKFKVLKTFYDYNCTWCTVEYTKGIYKGDVVDVPLEDMPLTVEDRT